MVKSRVAHASGFSLIELMMVVALAATVLAIAVPVFRDLAESQRLSAATSAVERELQAARLKAVSSNQTMRVWFNCPAAGQYRTVEVLGSAADTAADRCSPATYPYPAPDTDVMTRPNQDGPLRYVMNQATVSTAVVQFRSDGTAREVVGGVAQGIAATLDITVTRKGITKTVTINALGKVQKQ